MNSPNQNSSGRAIAIFAVITVILMLFPVVKPPVYFISFLFSVFMYVCLATSWNLVGGYAGYLSFGHVAFFGIGAYATALVAKFVGASAAGTIVATLPAGVIAAMIAVIVGYPCLRLRGPYFAVITLCFAFVIELVVKNLEFAGGADGLWLKSLDVPILISRSVMYELMLLLTAGTVLFSRAVSLSRFGSGLRAIKEDEQVAQTMAINAPVLKIKAFAVSAFFPGIAGGIFACYLTYIHPNIVFDVNMSILIVLMALFGGGSSWLGPIVGASLLTIINEILSTFVNAELARVLYGCLFIVVIIFMPNGIIEFFTKKEART
jgi:branched-chain amino acid transport system permease protein